MTKIQHGLKLEELKMMIPSVQCMLKGGNHSHYLHISMMEFVKVVETYS